MAQYEIALPESGLIELFNKQIQPMRQKCKKTVYENRTLSRLRDTLLPKLISGELRITDAQKLAEGAMG